MEAKKELVTNLNIVDPETAGNLEQKFLEYTYYKASVLKYEGNAQFEVLKSYNTNIAIKDNINGILILNWNYYNCSTTTKRHLDYYVTFPETLKILYLPECIRGVKKHADFYQLETLFYNKEFQELNNKIKQLTIIANREEKLLKEIATQEPRNLSYLNPVATETQQLKTRFKIIETNKTQTITYKIITTWKGTKKDNYQYREKDHLKTEIKLISDTGLTYDNVKFNDKKLYNGWDFLRSSRKADYIDPAVSK